MNVIGLNDPKLKKAIKRYHIKCVITIIASLSVVFMGALVGLGYIAPELMGSIHPKLVTSAIFFWFGLFFIIFGMYAGVYGTYYGMRMLKATLIDNKQMAIWVIIEVDNSSDGTTDYVHCFLNESDDASIWKMTAASLPSGINVDDYRTKKPAVTMVDPKFGYPMIIKFDNGEYVLSWGVRHIKSDRSKTKTKLS